jgi:hypothetical protein
MIVFTVQLRISNKYGSITRNKFLLKNVTPRKNITYIQNTHHFRGFKFTFVDSFKFRLIEEFAYEIDVWFQEKFVTNNDLILILSSPKRLKFLIASFFKALLYLLLFRGCTKTNQRLWRITTLQPLDKSAIIKVNKK